MNVLIIKHVDIEGPGLIEYCLRQRKIPYQILCLGTDDLLPKPDGFTHIVLLGGPMNVYEEDRYPFLRGEDLFIKEAIQRGKHILGICLGAQLIAKALGAKVTKAPSKEIGMIRAWMEEYEEEAPSLKVETLTTIEKEFENVRIRGVTFFNSFFRG
ncbi:MAG: type 1 glutamine amidotransferase [Deltaproteobacteria bacterium]